LGKNIISRHYSSTYKENTHTKQHIEAFHTSTIAHKPYNYETKLKIGRFKENMKEPTFPYLEKASQKTLTPTPTNTTAPKADLRVGDSGTD